MRVLTIGSDRQLFVEGSAVSLRARSQAEYMTHNTIIVFTGRGYSTVSLGEKVTVLPTNSFLKVLYGFGALYKGLALRGEIDVVSVQDPFETGLVGLILATFLGVPLHAQVHTDFLSPYFRAHSFINRLRIYIAGAVLRRAAHVRVVSKRILEGVEKKYSLQGRTSVLPVFVDVAKIKNAHSAPVLEARYASFTYKLLVVARLEPEKNVLLALRAFASCKDTNACLIIVGEGSQKQLLEAEVRVLGVGDRVFFEGRQDSLLYYPLASLVLVPSLYEGYGLVIVEALAAGKPVLATDVGVAREEGALVASPEQFAEALEKWFVSGERTMQLSQYPYTTPDAYFKAYAEDIARAL